MYARGSYFGCGGRAFSMCLDFALTRIVFIINTNDNDNAGLLFIFQCYSMYEKNSVALEFICMYSIFLMRVT